VTPGSTPAPGATVTAAPSTPPASDGLESPGPSRVSPSVAPTDWEPVPDQAAASQTQLSDVVWTGSRFVAAGVDANSAAAFVDSTDGLGLPTPDVSIQSSIWVRPTP
jgi:hypothetical protein